MFVGLVVAVSLLASVLPQPDYGQDHSDTPPPAVLAGSRSVTTRNNSGGIQRLTTIPVASAFASYGGGRAATCSFTADRDDFELSNGDRVPNGTRVTSNYLFVEGAVIPIDLPLATLPDVLNLATNGPLENATRTFTVFCDRAYYDVNQLGLITVPMLDPLLDPHLDLQNLRNSLQLDQPSVYTNPIVTTFGGLVTRYPAWLAIQPDSWRNQRSPARVYRGTTLLLIAEPRELTFTIDFVPNPDKPSPAAHLTVSCVPDLAPIGDDDALPAFPALPEQAAPGINGPCMWTPPGPGTVTITAHTTYTITFWAGGYTEPDDDYIRDSLPMTYITGELNAVNTKP